VNADGHTGNARDVFHLDCLQLMFCIKRNEDKTALVLLRQHCKPVSAVFQLHRNMVVPTISPDVSEAIVLLGRSYLPALVGKILVNKGIQPSNLYGTNSWAVYNGAGCPLQ
jgi:hypothetical protein